MSSSSIYRALQKHIVSEHFSQENLHFMSRYELIQFCKQHYIKRYSTLKKQDIMQLIKKHRREEIFVAMYEATTIPTDLINCVITFMPLFTQTLECRRNAIKRSQQLYQSWEKNKLFLSLRTNCKIRRETLISWFKNRSKTNDELFLRAMLQHSTVHSYHLYIQDWEKVNVLTTPPKLIKHLHRQWKWLK